MTTTTIYLLAIEIIVLSGAIFVWFSRRGYGYRDVSLPEKSGKDSRSRKPNPTLHELENQKLIPWGWPNHIPKHGPRTGKPEIAESMYKLMECIMMEKRLITEGDIHLVHDGIPDLRPEDGSRQGARPKNRPATQEQAAKRDGKDEFVDIIDVFGQSKNVNKYSRLGRIASGQAVFRRHDANLDFRQFEEKKILRPWGW